MTQARVTQTVIEELRSSTDSDARVSQIVIEELRSSTTANAQVSQVVIEVLRLDTTELSEGEVTIQRRRPIVNIIA